RKQLELAQHLTLAFAVEPLGQIAARIPGNVAEDMDERHGRIVGGERAGGVQSDVRLVVVVEGDRDKDVLKHLRSPCCRCLLSAPERKAALVCVRNPPDCPENSAAGMAHVPRNLAAHTL